jgi:chemotaxis protein MotB
MLPKPLERELEPVAEEPEAEAGFPAWMITFADMMSLLFAFFLLLLSFANVDLAKFRRMLGSIQTAFGVDSTQPGGSGMEREGIFNAEDLEARYIDVAETLASLIAEDGLTGAVEVEASAEGVVLRIRDSVMYTPGQATLRPAAETTFRRLAERLRDYEGLDIVVEGHCDSTAISNDRFPSNWELAAARATGAVRYLVSRGVPSEKVVAVGFGDSRPVAPNDTEEHRARNRRIEVRLQYPLVEGALDDGLTPGAAGGRGP